MLDRLGWRVSGTGDRKPRDHGHFDLLAARYKYLRTFTLTVIAALPLTGNMSSPDVAALMAAVEVLRQLNSSGRTTVPEQATSGRDIVRADPPGAAIWTPRAGPRSGVPALLGTERAVRGAGRVAFG